jgi:hypothetical protein
MPFDLGAAMRAAGKTPDMYETQQQAMQDLQARAANDQEFRRRIVTERARNHYRSYMGKEPPDMSRPQQPGQPQQFMQPQPVRPMQTSQVDSGDDIRALLAQLRQLGAIG